MIFVECIATDKAVLLSGRHLCSPGSGIRVGFRIQWSTGWPFIEWIDAAQEMELFLHIFFYIYLLLDCRTRSLFFEIIRVHANVFSKIFVYYIILSSLTDFNIKLIIILQLKFTRKNKLGKNVKEFDPIKREQKLI